MLFGDVLAVRAPDEYGRVVWCRTNGSASCGAESIAPRLQGDYTESHQPLRPHLRWKHLERGSSAVEASRNATNAPDFLALGLGGTNMMSMLWTVSMGRRAVGVEMRGDPFLGVHWNIREDFYHQLGLIDKLMLDRYGEARVPHRKDGRIFSLADCFYSAHTVSGDIVADEIIDGYDTDQHIVGTIQHIEFIDDRWRDGLPNRVVTLLEPPTPPTHPDARKIRAGIAEVLDGPSTFQAEAASILKLLRRYLELIEQLDQESHREPRVRLFTHHRVLPEEGDGFIPDPDGRLRVRIEALQEFDYKGQFVRVREPGSAVIDLGAPELFMIAEGFNSADAKRLGFEQHDVEVDHADGRGSVVAQADFVAGLLDVLVGGRLRRRIASAFDEDDKEYWVRQIAVGHENDPEVGWVLVQVPDFQVFDPIAAGLVPAGTDSNSPEYFAAYQHLLYEYFMQETAAILEISPHELKTVQMIYGPTLFSLVERIGDDALVAANGVVAGDSFGNGHFLTSGGAMTGMVGHSARVLAYWRARDAGAAPADAIRHLADSIREDTLAWLYVSAQEYSQAAPINFGAERIEQISRASGIDPNARANAIDAARRQRHALIPLDPSNWRRLFVHNGRVLSTLPQLGAAHPQQPSELASTILAKWKSERVATKQESQTGATADALANGEQAAPDHAADGDQRPQANELVLQGLPPTDDPNLSTQALSIAPLEPEAAKVYVCLDIEQNERTMHRIIVEGDAMVGRADPKHGFVPEVDLTPFDAQRSVSRQHARIYFDKTDCYIEDLQSRNQTQVGAKALVPHTPEALRDGDEVSFGRVKATVRLLGTSDLPLPWSMTGTVWMKPPGQR